jgi:hypothetical protein
MAPIEDPEVRLLASISATLEGDYMPDSDDPWEGSPFDWIRSRPSRQRGAIGEQLVAGWCAAKGLDVTRSSSSDADRVIHGHRVEIKFSTLWQSRVYKFQQIRDQEYDYLLCLGVSPFDAHAWLLPKAALYEYVIGHMGQHTGASGTDTAWLSFPSDVPHGWMKQYGGTLSDVWRLFESMPHGRY